MFHQWDGKEPELWEPSEGVERVGPSLTCASSQAPSVCYTCTLVHTDSPPRACVQRPPLHILPWLQAPLSSPTLASFASRVTVTFVGNEKGRTQKLWRRYCLLQVLWGRKERKSPEKEDWGEERDPSELGREGNCEPTS